MISAAIHAAWQDTRQRLARLTQPVVIMQRDALSRTTPAAPYTTTPSTTNATTNQNNQNHENIDVEDDVVMSSETEADLLSVLQRAAISQGSSLPVGVVFLIIFNIYLLNF